MARNDQSDNLMMYYFILLSALVIGNYISNRVRNNNPAASMFRMVASLLLIMTGYNMQSTSLPVSAMLAGTGMGIGLNNLVNMTRRDNNLQRDGNNDESQLSSTRDVTQNNNTGRIEP